jgi:hypothetical protein
MVESSHTVAPPTQSVGGEGGGGGGVEQFTQLMVAAHPVEVIDPSEVNKKVKHPLGLFVFAAIVPGLFVPANVPNNGAAVELPLYTDRTSQQASVLKLEKAA